MVSSKMFNTLRTAKARMPLGRTFVCQGKHPPYFNPRNLTVKHDGAVSLVSLTGIPEK